MNMLIINQIIDTEFWSDEDVAEGEQASLDQGNKYSDVASDDRDWYPAERGESVQGNWIFYPTIP